MATNVTSSVSLSVIPYSFLLSLLETSETSDASNRLIVQKILHSLLDKHGNTPQLMKLTLDVSALHIMYQKCSDTEVNFIITNGRQIYSSLFRNLQHVNNPIENIHHVYTTLALICTEFTSQRMLPDFFHFLISVQEMARENDALPDILKYEIHLLIVSLFSLAAHIHSLHFLEEYIKEIITLRKSAKTFHTTENHKQQQPRDSSSPQTSPTSKVFFETSMLAEVLEKEGISAAALSTSKLFYEKQNANLFVRSYTKDSVCALEDTYNKSEPDSRSSSPNMPRKYLQEDLTFEGIKRILTDSQDKVREKEVNQCAEIFKNCKYLPFEDLCSMLTRQDDDTLIGKVNEISDKIKTDHCALSDSSRKPGSVNTANVDSSDFPACQMYPEVFVY